MIASDRRVLQGNQDPRRAPFLAADPKIHFCPAKRKTTGGPADSGDFLYLSERKWVNRIIWRLWREFRRRIAWEVSRVIHHAFGRLTLKSRL